MTILDKCKALVAGDKTEEALTLLAGYGDDTALILTARYTQANKQYQVGLIDRGDFLRVKSQTNYHLLELAATIKAPQPAESDALRNLLREAYYHLLTLRSFANAGFMMRKIDGLDEVISETEKTLFA